MSRALLILNTSAERAKALSWIAKAPAGTRVEFKGPKRSLDQNSRLWAMLTDVATQAEHSGRKYSADQWKIIFMHACGREVQFIPSLDSKTFIPFGQSSADLSKPEMTELIDFIHAWGAQNGVKFHGPDEAAEPSQRDYMGVG